MSASPAMRQAVLDVAADLSARITDGRWKPGENGLRDDGLLSPLDRRCRTYVTVRVT
ncbi:hypothetical protein [Streptomyces paludis]|uniref:hypothetical protein n=1 Tax=Streptomyces paludis TaxID=2282738 RepID=UPI0013B3763A|nr:hypothetical protein [Streptomyces paludis]